MNQSSQLLQAESLRQEYGNLIAVEDVSLSLRKGEVLGLLGLNGAGKSTTLSMLSGVLTPNSGWIKIHGQDIAQYPKETKSCLGYLPDTPPLYPELRVREYLGYAARLRGVRRNRLNSAIDRAIQLCQLEQVSQRIIGNLSKGYRQRVGLAQALIHKPQLLILDEPSSGLDPIQMIQMRQLISDLAMECGVILSTHILPEVTAVCQRVAVIHQGKIIHEELLQSGKGSQFSHHYLSIRQSVTQDELLSLDSIASAEAPDQGSWQIAVPSTHRDRVISEIVSRGWQVLEFSNARNFLEERFAALTIGQNSRLGKAV